MGKFYKLTYHFVGLFCASAFAVQALAADPPTPRGNVSTTVNPTTGYRVINSSTISTPPNATISPVRDITPVVSKYSGGLQQSMPAGITIDGVKESHPISAKVRATTNTLKGGAKSLLRGGVAGMALTSGLQNLLDGIGALIEDGQVVQMKPKEFSDPPPHSSSIGAFWWPVTSSPPAGSCRGSCVSVQSGVDNQYGDPGSLYCDTIQIYQREQIPFVGFSGGQCYYRANADPHDGFFSEPMPPAAIDDAVDEFYEPEPDDWQLLSPRIQPDDVEIDTDSLPSPILGEPTTETDYDANGNPTRTRQTTPSFELEPRDNPSPEPKIDIKMREETVIFNEYGDIISSSTTTSTATASGGGALSVDIPTDCEFMPTVCRFLDWFSEPDPEMSEEPDLKQLMQTFDPDESTYDFGPDTMACPEPYTIAFSLLPSVEVSLQPICDVVDRVRPLVLALAYIFSGILLVRNI